MSRPGRSHTKSVAVLIGAATLGALTGCLDDPAQGGQSGSLVPGFCEEVDRIAISDPSMVQPEAGHAAQDVLDAMTGPFSGDWRGDPLTFDLLHTGDVEFVWLEYVENDGDQSDPVLGAPEPGADPMPGAEPEGPCAAFRWEIPVQLTVVSLPTFDEQVDAVLVATALDAGTVGLELALDDVNGTAMPDWDPASFDQTTLRIDGTFDGLGWNGSVSWSSSTDDGDGTGTGSVSPAEGFTATR